MSSELFPVRSGVPQGSVLGPLLFSLLINDLSDSLSTCSYHLFADDVQIYTPLDRSYPGLAILTLNDELRLISIWAHDNYLCLNPIKSHAIVFSLSRSNFLEYDRLAAIYLDGNIVEYRSTVVNLGLTLNRSLTWGDHIRTVTSKVFSGLRSLWLHATVMPTRTRSLLVKSLLVPIITYGDVVFRGNMSGTDKKAIKRMFNGLLRFAYGLDRYSSTSRHESRLFGCDIFKYLEFRSCVFIHRLMSRRSPDYLCSLLKPSLFFHRNFSYVLPLSISSSYNGSFFVRGVALWNELPLCIRRIAGVGEFRHRCRDYYCD